MDLSGTILALAILVNAMDHVTAGWFSREPVKFGEDCESFWSFLFPITCVANLVCFPGASGPSKCLCPTFTTMEKVCQPTYTWKKEACWEQCVGTPGRRCAENLAPNKRILWDSPRMQCVKNAECVTDDKRSLCMCKSGYLPFPPKTPVSCRRESQVIGMISGARKTSPYPNVQLRFRPRIDKYKRNHSCRWGSHLDLFALTWMLGRVIIVLMITTY